MNNLAAERKRRGLTQEQAARQLSVAVKTLGKYENDPLCMPGDFIVRAVKFYGCAADYLLGVCDERRLSAA